MKKGTIHFHSDVLKRQVDLAKVISSSVPSKYAQEVTELNHWRDGRIKGSLVSSLTSLKI